jgi:prophage regulatory protein
MTRFLRQRQVCEKVGLSPMTIWRRQKSGTFPRRVLLGPNAVGWVEEEIEAWCAKRVRERDEHQPHHAVEAGAADLADGDRP